MKIIKKTVFWLVFIIAIAIVGLLMSGNSHLLNGISKTYFVGKSKPDIDDKDYFDLREIPTGNYQPWNISKQYNAIEISDFISKEAEEFGTVAFLVIHRDSIITEKYWEDYTEDSYSNSFSMAKSYLSILIGIAIDEGKIESVNQKVSDFLPEFSEGELTSELTIEGLLTMTSGIDFGESYSNPFGFQAKAYYGKDLKSLVKPYWVTIAPKTEFKYEGGNSILLGIILEQATGVSISEYFSEKVWKKIGAKHPAYWNLDDENGMEKTFSAVYSNARDFARLGKLYLNDGTWNQEKIISKSYIENSVEPINVKNKAGENVNYYGYHYWLGTYDGKPFYCHRGMRGQYVIVVPEDDLIVVRLGHDRPAERKNNLTIDTYYFLDEAYRILKNQ